MDFDSLGVVQTDISIDKLSFTARLESQMYTSITEYLSQSILGSKENFTTAEYYHSPKNFMYQHNWKLEDGSFFQIGMNDGSREYHARLEFNPNKCNWIVIYNMIKRLKHPTITRLDFAVDYKNLDLSEYEFVTETSRTSREFRGRSGALETKYIGSPESDRFTRIYDKAKETRKGKRKEVEEEIDTSGELWWRIEAVEKKFDEKPEESVYDGWDDKLNEPIFKRVILSDYDFMRNPFNFVVMKKRKSFSLEGIENSKLKIQEKAMMFYLYHHPEEYKELSPNTRKKFKDFDFVFNKELLQWDLQPSTIFEQKKADLKAQIEEWLKPAIDNTTHLLGKK